MRSLFIISAFLCLLSCSVSKRASKQPLTEFRGVWIATVVNIDWPKNGTDATEKQKQDFIKILEFYQELNFNAAVVQIRTAGDAFYKTDLAPWSRYLTGTEGQPPKDFESPLKWMIAETHKRGMEFHAWLNPYRATFDLDTLELASNHDYYTHPNWMIKYGKKYYYNPGLPEVQQKLSRVIEEVVQNYDVDAIHFDDYFYPYKIKGEVFNDSLSFQEHALPDQDLEDWRRSNVDSLVKKVHQDIKRTKPWVQFGISPFGVWKNKDTDPNGSDTRAGQTTYEDLYADPLLWMEKGWLDYLVPQVYWSMDYPPASHRVITQWWANKTERSNLYIGNGPYKIKNNADKAWNRKKEIPTQLKFSRAQSKITGNVFFSAKSLMDKHPGVTKTLQRQFYEFPAKNPIGLIKTPRKMAKPSVTSTELSGGKWQICVTHSDAVPRFINYYYSKSGFTSDDSFLTHRAYLSPEDSSHCLELNPSKIPLGVSLSDAYGNETEVQQLTTK